MFGFARKRPSADREADVPIQAADASAPSHGWMDSAMELQQGLDVVEIDTLPADLFAIEAEHPPRRSAT